MKALQALSTSLMVMLLFTFDAHAAKDRKFPHGCRDVGYEYKDGLLVFKPVVEDGAQTLFLLHNKSHYKVHLQLVKLPHKPFAPKYENEIKGNQWGAFATDLPVMQFKCSYDTGYDTQQTDCAQLFEICQYTRAKFSQHNGGNYWVINSGTQRNAVYGSIHNGILLRW